MTILEINKYYYMRRGGERYMLEFSKILEANGHEVIPFAMHHPKNFATKYSKYFVTGVQTKKPTYGRQGLRTFGRTLYSFEAQKKLQALIDATSPDVAHIHNIYYQLSPSVLKTLKKNGIKTVMTVHDYNLISPNYSMFSQGEIKEWGKRDIISATLGRAHKDSLTASFAASLAYFLHRGLKLYKNNVDIFACPSKFVADKLIEYGFPANKVEVVPHFIDSNQFNPSYNDEGYVLYYGALNEEKGIQILIDAMKDSPNIPCKIVGDGPYEYELKLLASRTPNVEFVGRREGDELWDIVRGARLVVVPSIWYEVFGLTALEAMALGKPVIASKIGGLQEVVVDNLTGLLVEPRNDKVLNSAIKKLYNDPEMAKRFGEEGRKLVKNKYNPETHYQRMIELFR